MPGVDIQRVLPDEFNPHVTILEFASGAAVDNAKEAFARFGHHATEVEAFARMPWYERTSE